MTITKAEFVRVFEGIAAALATLPQEKQTYTNYSMILEAAKHTLPTPLSSMACAAASAVDDERPGAER